MEVINNGLRRLVLHHLICREAKRVSIFPLALDVLPAAVVIFYAFLPFQLLRALRAATYSGEFLTATIVAAFLKVRPSIMGNKEPFPSILRSKIFLIRRRWQQFLSETPCQQATPWHRLPPD